MLALLFWFLNINMNTELRISISNICEAKGSIYVALYDNKADFLNTDKIRAKKIVPVNTKGTIDIAFLNLPEGSYSISCFHDVNGNGKLDTNFLGIPTEPYGFSNNARPKFRAPNWEETKFYLRNIGGTQAVRLEKW